METRECNCRNWQISGIPCKHDACIILYLRKNLVDYVHAYLKNEAFMRTYYGIINPIPTKEFWDDVGCEPLLSPNKWNPIGRPKKLRQRELGEPFAPKNKGYVHKRGNCGSVGHNKKIIQTSAYPAK